MKYLLLILITFNVYADDDDDRIIKENRAKSLESGNESRDSVKMHLSNEKDSKDETIYKSHTFNSIKDVTPPEELIAYEGEFDVAGTIMFCRKGPDITGSCYYKNQTDTKTTVLAFCIGTSWIPMFKTMKCTGIEFKLNGKDKNTVKSRVSVKYINDRFAY